MITFDLFGFATRSLPGDAKPLVCDRVLKQFKVSLFPNWYSEVTLAWEPNPDWVQPRFNVYRSECDGANATLLTEQPTARRYFRDLDTNKVSKYSLDSYFVEVIVNGKPFGRSEVISAVPSLPTWHSLRLKEINRREWILLSRFTGQKTLVLKHVKYGQYFPRCNECWDDTNKILLKDYCLTCYGTSYKLGYYPGIPTYVQYDNLNKVKATTEYGVQESGELSCWMIRTPAIDVDDLLVRLTDFTVYRVRQVQDSELLSNTVRQMLSIVLLPKTSVEYHLLKREGALGNMALGSDGTNYLGANSRGDVL